MSVKEIYRVGTLEILKHFKVIYKGEDLVNLDGVFFGFYTIDVEDIALVSVENNIVKIVQSTASVYCDLTEKDVKILEKNPGVYYVYDIRLKLLLCSENGEEITVANNYPIINEGSRKKVIGLMWDTKEREYKVNLCMFYVENDILPIRAFLKDCKYFKVDDSEITDFGIYAMTQIASYGRSLIKDKIDIKEPVTIDGREYGLKNTPGMIKKIKEVFDTKHKEVNLRSIIVKRTKIDTLPKGIKINIDIPIILKCKIIDAEIVDSGGRKFYLYIATPTPKADRDKLEDWITTHIFKDSLVIRRS
jgi:hypothetical protein